MVTTAKSESDATGPPTQPSDTLADFTSYLNGRHGCNANGATGTGTQKTEIVGSMVSYLNGHHVKPVRKAR